MAEWSIAAVLKTVEGNTSGGSNPSFSALRPLKRATADAVRRSMRKRVRPTVVNIREMTIIKTLISLIRVLIFMPLIEHDVTTF
jgi:hypothetical protein